MVAPQAPNTASPPLMCRRCVDVPTGTVIPPGVSYSRCTTCRERVFVSAVSKGMIGRGECHPVCEQCVGTLRVAHPNMIGVMTAEQLVEYARQLADNPDA